MKMTIAFDAPQFGDPQLDQVYCGAQIGARRVFGDGTGKNDPHSIATDAAMQVKRTNIQLRQPWAYGYEIGRRKAISCLRHEAVEQRYLANLAATLKEGHDVDPAAALVVQENREELLQAIFSLPPLAQLYLLGELVAEYDMESIGRVSDEKEARVRSASTHRNRRIRARRLLKSKLES